MFKRCMHETKHFSQKLGIHFLKKKTRDRTKGSVYHHSGFFMPCSVIVFSINYWYKWDWIQDQYGTNYLTLDNYLWRRWLDEIPDLLLYCAISFSSLCCGKKGSIVRQTVSFFPFIFWAIYAPPYLYLFFYNTTF